MTHADHDEKVDPAARVDPTAHDVPERTPDPHTPYQPAEAPSNQEPKPHVLYTNDPEVGSIVTYPDPNETASERAARIEKAEKEAAAADEARDKQAAKDADDDADDEAKAVKRGNAARAKEKAEADQEAKKAEAEREQQAKHVAADAKKADEKKATEKK